jgi:hypothetical protein
MSRRPQKKRERTTGKKKDMRWCDSLRDLVIVATAVGVCAALHLRSAQGERGDTNDPVALGAVTVGVACVVVAARLVTAAPMGWAVPAIIGIVAPCARWVGEQACRVPFLARLVDDNAATIDRIVEFTVKASGWPESTPSNPHMPRG